MITRPYTARLQTAAQQRAPLITLTFTELVSPSLILQLTTHNIRLCSLNATDTEETSSTTGWWSGVVVSALASINEVNQR